MAQTCLPPGFRFHPTDVELVSYYLKRKIMGKKLFVEAISEVELYKFAPWDLPNKSCLQSKDLEWFFFCPRDKKYPKGSRTNRATPNGYRKTSGKDRTIELNSRIVGLKKTLIFHEGKAPKGNRTDWVMYEYKMEDETLDAAGFSKDAYVLCKIFKKSGLGPRIGEQYGAPFDENEWKNLEVGSSIFSFAPSSGVEDPQVESSALATPVIQEPFAPQQSIQFSEHVNICSNEDNNAPPEIDGIWLEELAMFLNDSPNHDIALPENSGLPPMSELEAQAFEMNTAELYDQLAGLAQSGDMSNVKWSNNGVFLLPLCSLRNILRRRSVMQTGPTTVASGSAYAEFGKTKVIVSVFGPRESKKAMLYSDTGRLNCSVSYITFATGIRGQGLENKEYSGMLHKALEGAVMQSFLTLFWLANKAWESTWEGQVWPCLLGQREEE
ncbi:hypothetical protein ZWY2020_036919 [Hordeum vulgare]|nr:hypothetical protein ZWY2020_036919 [Hordeum vulgare]